MPTNQRPLAVDLDGSLIHTDLLHESVLALIKSKPHLVFAIPFWLFKGKSALKEWLSNEVSIDVTCLPFNKELIEWLKIQKEQGRKLILCTASNAAIAKKVAEELGLFDQVLASDRTINLSGSNKAQALISQFGANQFDYVGNSSVDIPVWRAAKNAIVISNSATLEQKAASCATVELVIKKKRNTIRSLVKALRMHQWIKNLLIFVPLLAAHQATGLQEWMILFAAFISFSVCASAIYVVNDLLDLESDRHHLRKRLRPFASGDLPVSLGLATIPILLILSFSIAWHVGSAFMAWLLIYCAFTFIYSWRIKQIVLVDCLTLAILYTLRIVAGASAASVSLSFWLIAFSIFLFLSLAFIKRYAELEIQLLSGQNKIRGRGYLTSDAPLIQQLGVSSGYCAVLVLALYLNSENVVRLYRTPEIIWGAVPLMLLWLSWMWLKAHRGLMHDDPIVFAIKDRTSLAIGAAFITTFLLASWL